MRLSPTLLRRSIGLRFLSQSLTASPPPPPPSSDGTTVPLTYLEGFPKPDPKYSETIVGIPREKSGRLISGKERKASRVPSIVFEQADGEHGGNKRLISVQTKQMKKLITQLGQSFFLSRLFDLEVRPDFESDEIIEKVRVLPRRGGLNTRVAITYGIKGNIGQKFFYGQPVSAQLHLHSGTDEVLNVTFMRAPSGAKFKVNVPLLYRGEDACPGLRKGAYLNTIRRTVPFLCPADIVPPYIDVDLSELDVGQKLVMKDLKIHPAIRLYQVNEDWPICNVRHGRGSRDKKPEQKK